jgi:hypothetical protein
MGNLIKNHLARLVVLTAAACTWCRMGLYGTIKANTAADQVAAALEGFFWPKILWDFLTKNFDGAVKPIPILQIINLVFGLIALAWEWPLNLCGFPRTALHRSMEARIVLYPLFAVAAVILYQATNPALYYMIGVGMYFWAYSEGEVSFESPPSLYQLS